MEMNLEILSALSGAEIDVGLGFCSGWHDSRGFILIFNAEMKAL